MNFEDCLCGLSWLGPVENAFYLVLQTNSAMRLSVVEYFWWLYIAKRRSNSGTRGHYC